MKYERGDFVTHLFCGLVDAIFFPHCYRTRIEYNHSQAKWKMKDHRFFLFGPLSKCILTRKATMTSNAMIGTWWTNEALWLRSLIWYRLRLIFFFYNIVYFLCVMEHRKSVYKVWCARFLAHIHRNIWQFLQLYISRRNCRYVCEWGHNVKLRWWRIMYSKCWYIFSIIFNNFCFFFFVSLR